MIINFIGNGQCVDGGASRGDGIRACMVIDGIGGHGWITQKPSEASEIEVLPRYS